MDLPGGSQVVNPLGEIIAGPYYKQLGVFYATLTWEQILSARRLVDITGANARSDIFELHLKLGEKVLPVP